MARWLKTEVRRMIVDAVTAVVSPAGFRFKKATEAFVRKTDGGRQELGLPLVDYNPVFHFSFTLHDCSAREARLSKALNFVTRRLRTFQRSPNFTSRLGPTANEEGVAFGNVLAGSRVVAGDVQADLAQVWNGVVRADAIRKIGGDPSRLADAVRAKGAHHCYLELHIEQGAALDRENIPVGIVEGIVAIRRYEVLVTGVANHAGSTAMADRHDALLAASHLTITVNDVVNAQPGQQVGTVGKMDVAPNVPNVIPGAVKLTVELRDLSSEKLERLAAMIQERATEIAKHTRTSIEFTLANSTAPANAAVEAQRAIERVAGRLGLASRRLPSGAVHDAQMMAQLSPMGMIFVPSIGGVSHSPRELTTWDHCAQGADILLGTVLEMDRA